MHDDDIAGRLAAAERELAAEREWHAVATELRLAGVDDAERLELARSHLRQRLRPDGSLVDAAGQPVSRGEFVRGLSRLLGQPESSADTDPADSTTAIPRVDGQTVRLTHPEWDQLSQTEFERIREAGYGVAVTDSDVAGAMPDLTPKPKPNYLR